LDRLPDEIAERILRITTLTIGHRCESSQWSADGPPDDLQPFDAKQFAQALFEE